MVKRLGYLFVILAIAFSISVPAKADTISFNSNTSPGSSWTLSSPLAFQLSTALTSVQLNSQVPNTSIQSGSIGWSTGTGFALSPSAIFFNPGGSIMVTGDLGSGVVDLFTGSFQSASLTLLSGGAPDQSTFSASFIAGDVNSALYTFLNSSGLPTDVTGTLTATLNGAFAPSGGIGSVAGATISLDPKPVPEPGSGSLLAMGGMFLGLALTIGRKIALRWALVQQTLSV